MKRALEQASAAWERASSTLDFLFAGFTSRPPAPNDGMNVVGCGNANGEDALPTAKDGRIIEADMLLSPGQAYEPCEQANNSCTPTGGPVTITAFATHGFGHWLWLGDMTDPDLDPELTMSPGTTGPNGTIGQGSRHWATLALGDILGARAAYPCACPMPAIYTP